MPNQNIGNRSVSVTVRRLNSPCHIKTESDNTNFCITDLKVLTENIEPRGIASLEECHQLVSPSFIPYLQTALPFKPVHPSAASFGGAWFWETYRHALFGEDIFCDLSGTSNSLLEDSIDSQKELRKQLVSQKGLVSFTPSQKLLATNRIWLHSSARLEVMHAIALSVALHISQQPLLDQGEGPHALVLCAAKYQCDEMTFILNQFCAELHLVVHNLFEPFPSMPSSQRADVVVGTPPLWDSVVELGKTWDRKGLEEIISSIYGGGPPPTYTLSKWRPYTIRNMSQLVLFDLGLQINTGFGRMLAQILSAPGSNTVSASALPLHCQTYSVFGGDRTILDSGLKLALSEVLRTRGKCNKEKIAEVSIQSSAHLLFHTKKRLRLEEANALTSLPPRQTLSSGLLIKNAVSFSRLLVDRNAFEDFVDGILDKAALFWISFDDPEIDRIAKDSTMAKNIRSGLRRYVKCELVFACTTEPEVGLRVQEMCILLLPEEKSKDESNVATMKGARHNLLFRHLEEQLNGELFDGSVVSCVNFEDNLFRNYHYEFISEEGHALDSVDLFQDYFSVLGMGKLLLVTCVGDKDDKYIKETSRVDFFRNHSWSLSHSNAEVTPDMSKPLCDLPVCIPSHACLTPVHVRHTFTVVALRNVAKSIEALCHCQAVSSNEGAGHLSKKPFVLFLLEECCQYGRVVSYYCFEQSRVHCVTDDRGMVLIDEGAERISEGALMHGPMEIDGKETPSSMEGQTPVPASTATLFIEFETHDSALEAVRLLRERFHSYAATEKSKEVSLGPQIYMFRNTTYYAGVEQDLTHKKQLSAVLHQDTTKDEMNDFSLLAE